MSIGTFIKKAKSVPEYSLGWEKVFVGHKKSPALE